MADQFGQHGKGEVMFVQETYTCAMFQNGSTVPADLRIHTADNAWDAAVIDALERNPEGDEWEVRAWEGQHPNLSRTAAATVTAADLEAETHRAGRNPPRHRARMPWRESGPVADVLPGMAASRLEVGTVVLVTTDQARTNAPDCRHGLYPATDAEGAQTVRVTGKTELEKGGQVTVTLATPLGEVGPLRAGQAVLLAPETWEEAA